MSAPVYDIDLRSEQCEQLFPYTDNDKRNLSVHQDPPGDPSRLHQNNGQHTTPIQDISSLLWLNFCQDIKARYLPSRSTDSGTKYAIADKNWVSLQKNTETVEPQHNGFPSSNVLCSPKPAHWKTLQSNYATAAMAKFWSE